MLANLQQNLTQHLSSAFANGTTAKDAEAKVLHDATDTDVETDLVKQETLKALKNATGQQGNATQDSVAELMEQMNKN